MVDAERLKESEASDHFRELREIIRDIRASEANVYKEVRRICSLCSDYAAHSRTTPPGVLRHRAEQAALCGHSDDRRGTSYAARRRQFAEYGAGKLAWQGR